MGFLSPISPSAIAAAVIRDLFQTLSHIITQGILALATWGLSQLTRAASETTAVNFGTWFAAPWRAMLAVGGIVAVPLFFVGVLSALAKGEGPAGLAKVVGRLLGAAVGGVLALAGVELVMALVDFSCQVVEHGSGISLPAALARLGTALGAGYGIDGGVGGALLALLTALGAIVLWLELAVRSALIIVATAFIPLGLAGLLWPATASWMRRLAEVIAAVAVSKLVIVVVLVLGAAALFASPLSIHTPATDIDAMVTGVAFLALATLGLPMALRIVPMAAEAAISAGLGAAIVRKGLRAPATAARHVGTAQGVMLKLNGSGAAASAASKGNGAGAPTPTPIGAGAARSAGTAHSAPSGARPASGRSAPRQTSRPRPGEGNP